jgi:hypothetical protein
MESSFSPLFNSVSPSQIILQGVRNQIILELGMDAKSNRFKMGLFDEPKQ